MDLVGDGTAASFGRCGVSSTGYVRLKRTLFCNAEHSVNLASTV